MKDDRIMRRIFPALIVLTLYINTVIANSDKITFDKITVNEGLSSNTIFSIVQDKDGFMWFGSSEGLNRYDGSQLVSYLANPNDTNSLSGDRITCLAVSEDNKLLIGTTSGLNIYNRKANNFKSLKHNNQDFGVIRHICVTSEGSIFFTFGNGIYKTDGEKVTLIYRCYNVNSIIQYKKGVLMLSTRNEIRLINYHGELLNTLSSRDYSINLQNNISLLFKDSENTIWIGTQKDGLLKFDAQNNEVDPVNSWRSIQTKEPNPIRTIEEDESGRLWLGTESGVFIYNKNNGNMQHILQSLIPNSLHPNDNAIYHIYHSKEGIMWLATYFGGVNYYKPNKQGFNSMIPGYGNTIQGKAVSQIVEDSKKRLWIATEDGGITIFDKSQNKISHLNEASKPYGLSTNNIHSICEDDNGIYWIGTFQGGVNRYDINTGKITVFKNDPNDSLSISGNSTNSILKDKDGMLWFGTRSGLNILDKRTGKFKKFMPKVFGNRSIYEIMEDSDGCLWFGFMRSADLFCLNKKNQSVKRYNYSGQTPFLQTRGIISLCEDQTGQIWAGTINNGLLKLNRKTGKFTFYDTRKGLPNNTIYGIVENNGCLWLSTNKGLSKFDIQTEQFINYDISHNLPHNQYNYRSYTKDSDGNIYFGAVYGLTFFHPDSLKINPDEPIPYLTSLKIQNKTILPGPGQPITNDINSVDDLTLKYNQKVVTFEFSAIDLISESNNQFAYMLEGFDTDWNYIGKQRNATYTNLHHGDYTFKIKAANNDDVWSAKAHELKLTVKPPIYLTNTAKFLYLILFLGAIYLYHRYTNLRNREKATIEFERMEKNKIKELNQHKINFFTNISHELKTPLTLIIANVDKIIGQFEANDSHYKSLYSIKKHAARLHQLISQLMEFRKAESAHTQLKLKRGDLILFLSDTFNAFIPLYTQRSINYRFSSNIQSFDTLFDADKMEKITSNILTNSIKHCGEMDRISLHIELTEGASPESSVLKMTFTDSGVGIPAELLEKVFDPFVHDNKDNPLLSSSGIGLAFVKVLIDLLKGHIDLQSKEGEGTLITITIPLNLTGTQNNAAPEIQGNKSFTINPDLIDDTDMTVKDETDDSKWKVLIVEDNQELLNFLSDHFMENYNVIKAKNGKQGYEKAIKYLPDLIISDVVMPQMDGIELCTNLRENINTSHIPIILLTAKANSDNKHEALNAGADLYLPKPFDLKEVDILVSNFIASREKIKKHFISNGNLEIAETSLNNKDHSFISKLTEIVNQHLDDPDFDVATLTQEVGVSRSLLHTKLKKIVNLSTSEFVKAIRMKHAAELLSDGSLTVAEVAYKIGFSDPNYFSRTFKDYYGVNPSGYKQKSTETKKN